MRTTTAVATLIPDVPGDDADYCRLPLEERRAVEVVLTAMREAVAGASTISQAVERFAAVAGLTPATARRRWDNVLHHGWTGAADRRRCRQHTGDDLTGRTEFLEFFRALCDKHQRSLRAAWHDLVLLYKSGAVIPGYAEYDGHPPAYGRTGLPAGWSYANLLRHAPSRSERVLARIGRAAFSRKTTALWTTRVGLHCGQVYQFDDQWHDHDVFFGAQLVRPIELGAIDLFSTRRVLYGLMPRVVDADGASHALREEYMAWLVIGLLTEIGYHPDGCTLVAEHRTAAISTRLEETLHNATAGKIRTDRSGIANKSAILGWWAGEGGGNLNMKGCLESLHGYYRNRLGLLPAQTGSNSRTDKPENLPAIEKYGAAIQRQLAHLAPDQVDAMLGLLRLHALTFHQFHALLDAYYTVIDSRTEHDLEGWERAGLVRTQWRLSATSAEWHDAGELATLPDAQYTAVRALLDSDKSLMRPARLSPLRVWEEGRRGLRRLPPWCVVNAVPEQLSREVTVRDGQINYRDAQIDPDGVRFGALAVDPQSRRIILADGETYRLYLNPFFPSRGVLADAAGRYVGVIPRIHRAPRADRAALYAAVGQEAARQTAAMASYRARNAPEADVHQSMLAHNEAVFSALRAHAPAQGTHQSSPGEPDAAPTNVENWLASVGSAAEHE